jgi:HK97 family phage portal protein
MIKYLLPKREQAATVQQLGHPSAGVIDWEDPNANTSGEPVTNDIALTYSAVWCATRVISETVASLPCILYRRITGGKERFTEDERFFLVHDQPNDEQGAYTFFETETSHMVNWGNAYSRITKAGLMPVSLEPMLPAQVTVERNEDGILTFTDELGRVQNPDIVHPIGLGKDGLLGASVIKLAQQSIGTAIATDKHAGSFFGNGATPRGVIQHPQRLTKEQRTHFRDEWNEIHQGSSKANNVAIIHGGMEYKPIGMSNEEAQFLESRKFSVNEIARWYRLPSFMLGDLERATFSNIEELSLSFMNDSIMPWLKRWETELAMKLLTRDERRDLFFEFLVEGRLRGDTKTRAEVNAIARQWGWKSVNEIREEENLNAIDGGDVYLQPLNMGPAGTIPDTLGNDLQANLLDTVNAVRQTAQDIKDGLTSDPDSQLADALSSIRADGEEIRKEIGKLGEGLQVKCGGCHDDNLEEVAIGLIVTAVAESCGRFALAAQKAASRQINRNESFVSWLENYAKSRSEHIQAELDRVGKVYEALTHRSVTQAVCEQHVQHCKESLLDAADGDLDGFEVRVQQAVLLWEIGLTERVEKWISKST